MDSVKDLMKKKINQYADRSKSDSKKYVNHEFQDFGLRLAKRMGEPKKKGMYIRFAKVVPRAILQDAAAFVDSYPNATTKGKLFIWKVHQLLQEYKEKHPDFEFPKIFNRNKKKSKKKKKKLSKRDKLAKENYTMFNKSNK